MLRLIILFFIAITPFNFLRIFWYRIIMGYKIGKNVKIGFFTILDSKKVNIENNVTIRGLGNFILNLNEFIMEEGSYIGGPRAGFNFIRGRKKVEKDVCFKVGRNSHIELFHYFDVCQSIIIGNNTVLGGIKSVFWTHVFYQEDFLPIKIGNNCFIGSNVLFNMGVEIGDNNIIAMGSVVSKSFPEENCLIGGVPAKIIKTNYGYDAKEAYKLRNIPYYEMNQDEK